MIEAIMAHKINLDALIIREDFEVQASHVAQQMDEAPKIKIVELEDSSFFSKF